PNPASGLPHYGHVGVPPLAPHQRGATDREFVTLNGPGVRVPGPQRGVAVATIPHGLRSGDESHQRPAGDERGVRQGRVRPVGERPPQVAQGRLDLLGVVFGDIVGVETGHYFLLLSSPRPEWARTVVGAGALHPGRRLLPVTL